MKNKSVSKDIHGGNLKLILKNLGLRNSPEIIADFSVNINPAGSPLQASRMLMSADQKTISDYPDIYADNAASALAEAHCLPASSTIVGNGSTELFSLVIQSLKPAKIAWISPCYSGYSEICSAHGIEGEACGFSKPGNNFKISIGHLSNSDADMFFLCTPNNPTGAVIDKGEILAFASKHPNKFLVVDESFMDFLPSGRKSLFTEKLPDNVIAVKSLTKFFSLAGIRIGMLYASTRTLAKIAKARLPWSVNGFAQKIIPLLYSDQKHIEDSRKLVCGLRKGFSADLAKISGLKVYPSHANFLLCEIRRPKMDADKLQAELLKRGILIRSCSKWNGLGPNFFRLAVLDRDSNNSLISAMNSIFNSKISKSPNLKISKSPIMVVGTGSGSGKSLLVSALCRYFVRKGLRVAPFKAQNMSLNSFVTKEGGEMGRAQVVQAKAAKIEPHTDMNPVLLKPTGDAGSQLIVNGKATCNVTAKSYYEEKCELRKDAFKAFDRLAAKFDLIILEGAGSPAEINLQDKDFVNMAMAEHAKAKTILVADIDKGGVFASIYGTIMLIPPAQRKFIAGVVINKFRGDVSLLKPGIDEIEKLTGVPVLGVLPYIKDLRIEEEDSLGLEDRKQRSVIRCQRSVGKKEEAEIRGQNTDRRPQTTLDLAVVRLPRISNYTDFLTFETLDKIHVRYVERPDDLGSPDIIFIPGSKNTCSDMQFLRESGFEIKIKEARKSGIPVFGICGGYQMLGEKISDPHRVEGGAPSIKGLGLLPVETVLEKMKELSQVSGQVKMPLPFANSGTPFTGYEIHMGRTSPLKPGTSNPFVLRITRKLGKEFSGVDGTVSGDGLVFGTYIHGIFDMQEMRDSLIIWLCSRKGIDASKIILGGSHDPEPVFEKLADMVGKHLDLSQLQNSE
ncbi:MAG: cobyric acid synthase CobQ [Lentisphaerae bacterium GWF2_50_93]|nr:MAG: cobyric acid synthase CobQ [Lentisphaerae bacterium GWF2_50_93]